MGWELEVVPKDFFVLYKISLDWTAELNLEYSFIGIEYSFIGNEKNIGEFEFRESFMLLAFTNYLSD